MAIPKLKPISPKDEVKRIEIKTERMKLEIDNSDFNQILSGIERLRKRQRVDLLAIIVQRATVINPNSWQQRCQDTVMQMKQTILT